MSKYFKIGLLALIVVSTLLRTLRLDQVPPHLSNDEISIAYDAYSILHTGFDEHHHYLPVAFQSHNTYKAPLYIYLAVVSNLFLGNSEYSVRLPSAILGVLTVLLFGCLIWMLSNNLILGYLASWVLALTPWHIYTSRMALESNISLFFIMAGLVGTFYYLKRNSNLAFVISMLCFGLSIWGYHTEWLLTPMVLAGLYIFYFKNIKYNLWFWMGVVGFFGLVIPIANNAWINRGTTARANTELIFNDPGVAKVLNDKREGMAAKVVVIAKSFFGNYSDYVRFGYLFFDGLQLLPKSDPYNTGLFLFTLLPFFLLGIFKVPKYFIHDSKFIYFWVVVSPIVPSLTLGGTNMIRNLATVLPYCLLITVGLYDFVVGLKSKYSYILGLVVLAPFLFFLAIYFYHFPKDMGENFQYGYRQIASYIEANYQKYNEIVIDPRFGPVNIYIGIPHLYIPYFTKLNPSKLLDRKDTDKGLFFDKYQIRSINWNQEKIVKGALYIVPNDNTPDEKLKLTLVKTIYLPNGREEFKLFVKM